MTLIDRALDHLRCPHCLGESLSLGDRVLQCASCDARFPIDDGVIDFCPGYGRSQDHAQRAMESPLIVSIYEDYWRPWFTWFGSPISYAEEKDWLLAQHAPRSVECVLDVGSGTGRYARILADAYKPKLVISLDLSKPMALRGHRVAARQGYDNILFLRGNAQCIPVRDRTVDLLNCFGALHLFPEPDRALEEMARSAKPDTVLSCLTAAKLQTAPTTLRQRLFSRRAPIRLFDLAELQAMVSAGGFEDFQAEQRGLVLLFRAKTLFRDT